MKTWFSSMLACFAVVTLTSAFTRAETIELIDGKLLTGTIQSMDAQQVRFLSEDNQPQTISRDQIAQITFVDRVERRGFSLAAMLKELKGEGVDEETWQELKQQIRVMETPELRRYFDDTIAGLKDDLQNLRKDALEAETEIMRLREEYGPQADTLNDYLITLRSLLGSPEDAEANISVEVDVERDEEQEQNAETTASQP